MHYCSAGVHALGKYKEGSGMDTCAVESGMYSPAALCQIYSGKVFKRGLEYHLMASLACLYLKFEAILEEQTEKTVWRREKGSA